MREVDENVEQAWQRIREAASKGELVINPDINMSLYDECKKLGFRISRFYSKRDIIRLATSSVENYNKLRDARFDFMQGGMCIR